MTEVSSHVYHIASFNRAWVFIHEDCHKLVADVRAQLGVVDCSEFDCFSSVWSDSVSSIALFFLSPAVFVKAFSIENHEFDEGVVEHLVAF